MTLVTGCASSGGSIEAYCAGSERAMREQAAIAAESTDEAIVMESDRAVRQWRAVCNL